MKNRIRDRAFRLGIEFISYTKKNIKMLWDASPVFKIPVEGLEGPTIASLT
ncbi:MAG: hypothetical protein QXU18_11465 [Thermoplasmatales archaeon]